MYIYLLHPFILCEPPHRTPQIAPNAALARLRSPTLPPPLLSAPFLAVNPLVMHYFFALLSQLYGREVNVWSPATDISVLALVLPMAVLVCAMLSTPAARNLFWLLVEAPYVERLFRSGKEATGDEPAASAPAAAAAAGSSSAGLERYV